MKAVSIILYFHQENNALLREIIWII